MSEYHEEFLRESSEQITELNNALLTLESDADDREAMDAVFRTAHTLKGNAAAMGFEGIGDLAHALEDLLDEIRTGRLAVTPGIMDLAFDGVDRIEAGLSALDADEEVEWAAGDLADEIREVVETAAGTTAVAGTDDAADGTDDPDGADESVGPTPVAAAVSGVEFDAFDVDPGGHEEDLLHASVRVDGEMKGVDGMLVFDALTDRFDVLDSRPDRDTVEDGGYDDGFELVVAGGAPETLSSMLVDLGPVDDATVTGIPQTTNGDGQVATSGAASGTTNGTAGTAKGSTASTASDAGSDGAEASDGADDAPEESSGDDAADEGGTTDEGGASTGSIDEVKSVRVDVDQLEDLHGQVEQLVTSRIKLRRALENEDFDGARDTLGGLDKISTQLQDTVMDMQLIPLRKVVGKFPRLVRDLARRQDKQIDFRMEGEDIELDRTILTRMDDPLLHVLRNAVDHGIEPPDERAARGKPREGTIRLRARRERDHVLVGVEDDGRGLEVEDIREQAAEEGLYTRDELEEMDDSDVYDLIFHPGLSTSGEVTDVSGRGVGMDVVHSTVKGLDGSVNVESTPGEGTTVTLRLPVTVAIVTVLFVRVGEERFGVPIKAIDEVSRATDVRSVNHDEIVEHGEDLYPVVRLSEALDVADPAAHDGDGMLVYIRESERQAALYCDAVEDQEEVVVKPLEGVLSGIEGLSGTAVLGDGKIVPIIDVMTL